MWRRLAFVLVLVPVLGLVVTAQPPAPTEEHPSSLPPSRSAEIEKLKADLAALTGGDGKAPAENANVSERAKARAELSALLKRLESLPPPGAPRSQEPTAPKSKLSSEDFAKTHDLMRAAMYEFRDGALKEALGTLEKIDQNQANSDDRAFVRYLRACCLRRMGRQDEALKLFHEIAALPQEDEFIAECAAWQVSLIRAHQELQTQLEQLRARAKSK
jgi:hypothetical protein